MEVKKQRLGDLKKLIRSRKISGQDELLNELAALGYKCTQATLSRDLKEIRAGKVYDSEKGTIYILHEQGPSVLPSEPGLTAGSLRSVIFSYNLVVIKTFPGFAPGLSSQIDHAARPEIAGTVAGDDTILVVPHETFTRDQIRKALVVIFPDIESLF